MSSFLSRSAGIFSGNSYAVVQVAAEGAGFDGSGQVTMHGGDDTDVGANGLVAANALKFPLLQNAQEGDLCLGRKLADFIEEESSSLASSKRPMRRCSAPVKAPFSCPNNSDAIGLVEWRRSFAHKRTIRTIGTLVNCAGDQFFAGAGFARDQDCRVGSRDFGDARQYRLETR